VNACMSPLGASASLASPPAVLCVLPADEPHPARRITPAAVRGAASHSPGVRSESLTSSSSFLLRTLAAAGLKLAAPPGGELCVGPEPFVKPRERSRLHCGDPRYRGFIIIVGSPLGHRVATDRVYVPRRLAVTRSTADGLTPPARSSHSTPDWASIGPNNW
jgi:hypothetical protein